MAQIYTCLITKENLVVPQQIPHFKHHHIITFPIDIEFGNDALIEIIKRYKTGLPHPEELTGDVHLTEVKTIVDLVYELNLQNLEFAILFTSEWGAPVEDTHVLFRSGKIVTDSIYIADHNSDKIEGIESKVFDYLKIPLMDRGDFIADYNSYSIAKEYYNRADK